MTCKQFITLERPEILKQSYSMLAQGYTHIFYINLSFINILQKLLHQFLAQQATAQVLCFWCFYQQLSMLSMETKTAEAKCKALLKTHKQEL